MSWLKSDKVSGRVKLFLRLDKFFIDIDIGLQYSLLQTVREE
jgi:hypothetical protein